ncbi:MAG TPA: ABC transporter ATP-binding protein [Actinomycetota bacterium]|nr:ABC transporter ATP-binding protein [Actinomycetota bacterium]
MTPLAAARGVTRRFGRVLAISDAHLTVGPGEVVGLVGANGAGKTTLVRVLQGLIPPTSGRVELFGEPPSREARRRVGYVPQGLGLYPDLTVAENLAFVAAAYGAAPPPLGGDLAPVRDRLVGELPLGLQRRVAFAAASGHRPELLILDEPTSGVGPLGRARLWEDIRGAAERGAGVLVTTHYMREAEQCDRLVVLSSGRVVAEGTLSDILAGGSVVLVRTERWQEAFRALRDAGFRLGLSGRSLRVVEAGPERVRAALGAAGVRAEVEVAPATFEEAFLALAGPG